jgi:methionine biosynthesis protein MetW
LCDFPDGAFDYVILSRTLQAVARPDLLLGEMARVGRKVLISFINLGHWQARWQLLVGGRMPVTATLPHQWYDTHNLHFLSVEDFTVFCREKKIKVLASYHLAGEYRIHLFRNLLANFSLFLIT